MDAMLTTRQRLLQMLRLGGPLTAAEMSRSLGIGNTAVRQHVDRLQAQGWIEVVGLRRGGGRPGRVFALTPQADAHFPQGYDRLALELLDALSSLPDGSVLLRRVLAARREGWNERYGPQLAGKSLHDRLLVAIDFLAEQGNIASHEERPDGEYVLTKHHCSISRVTSRHRILCEEELIWLREVLQAHIETVHSRADGDRICSFRVVPLPEQRLREGVGSPGTGG
jgi:predicted ArsR family transcriptional regulator